MRGKVNCVKPQARTGSRLVRFSCPEPDPDQGGPGEASQVSSFVDIWDVRFAFDSGCCW